MRPSNSTSGPNSLLHRPVLREPIGRKTPCPTHLDCSRWPCSRDQDPPGATASYRIIRDTGSSRRLCERCSRRLRSSYHGRARCQQCHLRCYWSCPVRDHHTSRDRRGRGWQARTWVCEREYVAARLSERCLEAATISCAQRCRCGRCSCVRNCVYPYRVVLDCKHDILGARIQRVQPRVEGCTQFPHPAALLVDVAGSHHCKCSCFRSGTYFLPYYC